MDKDLNALDAALAQYRQAAQATEPTSYTTGGIAVIGPDGQNLGILPLTANAVRRLTGAVEAVTGFAVAQPADFLDEQTRAERLVIADVEDSFADVDPQSYLADVFDSQDAEASLIAYEQMVTGEWDGQL